MGLRVAVVGATGVVGREMLRVLEQRKFPATEVLALASARSAGVRLPFAGGELTVREASADALAGVQIVLMSAGAQLSRTLSPLAAEKGAIVIDNSSAWRLDPEVPLCVPEVNMQAAQRPKKGIIANPNCSTIQLVVALKPLHDEARVRHVVVSTYQAASGKGQAAVAELQAQTRAIAEGRTPEAVVFPGVLAGNVLMDWKAGADDYSEEELKMVHETRKIFDDAEIAVTPTTVRVPVVTGHSEAIYVRFERPLTVERARELLRRAEGVSLLEGPYAPGHHPTPRGAAGTDPVYVGRLRKDLSDPNALNLFVVADNLRKGAALNAVQIAERLTL